MRWIQHTANLRFFQDILGTENSVQLMTQKPVTTTYPWSGNKTRNTMKLERSFVETEDDGSLNWDFNGQTQVLVVNQNETNQYGEYRGYRSRSNLRPKTLERHRMARHYPLAVISQGVPEVKILHDH